LPSLPERKWGTSMTALRDIPGNQHAFDQLRARLTDGRAIAFVGACASAGLYPLWGGLIPNLVEETKERGRGSNDERAYWLKQRDAYPDQVARQGNRVKESSTNH
jgi:hypothetical protein